MLMIGSRVKGARIYLDRFRDLVKGVEEDTPG